MNDEKAARLAAIRAANAQKAAAQQPAAPPAPVDEKAARLAAIRAANAQKAATQQPAAPPAPSQPKVAPPAAIDENESAVALSTMFALLFAAIIGAFAAVVVLPRWLPGLSASLLGAEPKAYWYLARSSGLVAFGLLWLAMVLGLSITSKTARLWSGGPAVFDVHQFTSLLALAFGLFHALILLGDAFINYTLAQVLVPFASGGFRPVWVGLGQVALYVLALIDGSFYMRSRIGRRAWRLIHFLSFAVFLLALAHGITSGSDTQALWVRAMYWISAASALFLTIYRVLIARSPAKERARVSQEQARSSV